MRRVYRVCFGILLSLVITSAASAQQDQEPCCGAVSFQTFDRSEVSIQLVSVKRTGPDDITVSWRIRNHTKEPVQFDRMGGTGGPPFQLVWDAEVLDVATRTRYRVAKDAQTQIPASSRLDLQRAIGPTLGAGRTFSVWAKFLIPAGTGRVTVVLPGASQPWENIAITP